MSCPALIRLLPFLLALHSVALGQRMEYEDYLDWGEILFQRGEYRQAEDNYRSACILKRQAGEPHPRARFALVHSLFALGFYNFASNNLRLAVLDFQSPEDLEVPLEELFPSATAFKDRLRSLDNYLERVRSFNGDALTVKAYVLFKQGETKAAQAIFEQLLESDSEDPVAHFFLNLLIPPELKEIPELLTVLPDGPLARRAVTRPAPQVGPPAGVRFQEIPSLSSDKTFLALVR